MVMSVVEGMPTGEVPGLLYVDPAVLAEASNQCGRARAMTIFTPVKRFWGTLYVRSVFTWIRASATGTPDIRTLSFIHFARWGVIRRFPDYGQQRTRVWPCLFMFESNYNGSFEAYIDAFAQVLGSGMRAFWGSSYGFPGPLPVKPFKSYIRANEFVTAHYYSAYPAASVTTLLEAVATDNALVGLREKAPGMTPADFTAAYDQLFARPAPPAEPGVGRVQQLRNLVHELVIGARAMVARTPGHGSSSGRSYAFTSLVPIKPGQEAALAAQLASLSNGVSPFTDLLHVHFARFVVVDGLKLRWAGAPKRPPRLGSQYLLFTAALTALPGDDPADLPRLLLESMDTTVPGAAHAIWQHCLGYEGSATDPGLASYLPKSQVGTVLFYVGCPDTTVADARSALMRQRCLDDFAAAHQADAAADMRVAFVEESATWP
jgi:hypothetical protein